MAVTIKKKGAKPYPALSASPFRAIVLEYLKMPASKAKRMLRAASQVDPNSTLSSELRTLSDLVTDENKGNLEKTI